MWINPIEWILSDDISQCHVAEAAMNMYRVL